MNAPIDITGIPLRTPRMTLRPWRESDLEDFYAYAKVDGVGQMAGWTPHKNMEESRTILQKFIALKRTFALEYEGKVIGALGIEEYNEEHYPELTYLRGRELGYTLSRDYWGRGLMPEAVKAVTAYLFDTAGLDFLLVGHFDWNRQSARVIQKCGFRYIKNCNYETRYGTVENSEESILYNSKGRRPLTHKGSQTIETPRLFLRRAEISDAEPMYRNWASNPEVTKFLTWPPHASLDVTKQVLSGWIEECASPKNYNWMIVLKSLGEPIGNITARQVDDKIGSTEIGYCIGEHWWHCGIMSEALEAVLGFLFKEVGFNRIESRHDPHNPHSGDVMRKCGMTYEGTAREADWNNQGLCDTAHYAILRSEWAEKEK